MAVREIVTYPAPVLKEKSVPVEKMDAEVSTLIGDMLDTVMDDDKSVGLAANQVGVPRRVIITDLYRYDDEDDDSASGSGTETGGGEWKGADRRKRMIVLINPEITFSEGEIIYGEGCLSFPGITADIKRADHVKVKALDRDFNPVEIDAFGFQAVLLQHELDHLDGVLIIDRVSWVKRDMLKRKYKKYMAENAPDQALL